MWNSDNVGFNSQYFNFIFFRVKRENFRTMIYKSLKSCLDVILEKGETYEQRLCLDLYIELSLYENRTIELSNEIQKALNSLEIL